jgi:hypothetical protein
MNSLKKIVGLDRGKDDFIGVLEHHPNLRISLDLKKTITKHIAILAKSGAGKSYTVGVILEEILKKRIPIVILDPHNEYATLKFPNSNKKDLSRLEKFKLKPKGFLDSIKEFSPNTNINSHCEEIMLDINSLKPQDLIDSLPQKLSPAQQNIIFNILSNISDNRVNFDELIFNISNEESNSKWSLISLIEQLKKLRLYSTNPTPLNKIVKYNQASIISLKGVEPYVQETFVSGLLKELFEARKKEEIPPFLLVLEEAHNFCPERSFGELKTSKIIRVIAGEGRKFGIGLCVVSQRPAKVDKNVISQCSTQILLKITNPNDLKSVISSSEGVDSSSENEIQKLNIGTCLLTGVIDIPLKINVRPRISKHGGETVDITLPYELNSNRDTNTNSIGNRENLEDGVYKEQNDFKNEILNENLENNKEEIQGKYTEFLEHVKPDLNIEDAKTMLDSNKISINLLPAAILKLTLNDGREVSLLVEKVNGNIIKRVFPFEGNILPQKLSSLSEAEKKLFKKILELKDSFNPAELLLKTDMMFNEILRICDSLTSKGILKKTDKEFQLNEISYLKKYFRIKLLWTAKI